MPMRVSVWRGQRIYLPHFRKRWGGHLGRLWKAGSRVTDPWVNHPNSAIARVG
jgi:hypothetical protein